MKYALIGCGRIAGNHITAAQENGLEITAVCDIIPQRAHELAERFDLEEEYGTRVYTDYRLMYAEQKPQLVAVATDSGSHAAVALWLIEQGANVIIEKPVAMSLADADMLIAAAQRQNTVVCVNHQNRFNIAIRELKKAVDEGRFGTLSHGAIAVRWSRGDDYYAQGEWRGKWATDGGTLMNQCIHGIDLLRWMLGDEIDEVYGALRQRMHDYIEAEDVGVAVIKFKNGAVATVEGTVNTFKDDMEETLYIFGEKGNVKIGGKSANNIDIWEFTDDHIDDVNRRGLREKTENVYGNGHTSLYLDVIDAVKNDREPFVDLFAGKRALELVLAIYKSQHDGRAVKLPLCDFGSADMRNDSI